MQQSTAASVNTEVAAAHSVSQPPISPSSDSDSGSESDATSTVRDLTPQQTETLGTTAPADAAAVQQDTSVVTSSEDILPKTDEGPKPRKPFSSFTKKQKWGIVVISSVAGLFSPISSVILAPSLPVLAEQFQRSSEDINLTMTLYL